jgi:serine/threonine-protein kinase
LDPRNAQAHNDLAWLLATCADERIRNGRQAVEHAKMACERTSWKNPTMIATLAAAHSECGDFDQAVKLARQALELAPEAEREKMRSILKSCEAGSAVRDQ